MARTSSFGSRSAPERGDDQAPPLFDANVLLGVLPPALRGPGAPEDVPALLATLDYYGIRRRDVVQGRLRPAGAAEGRRRLDAWTVMSDPLNRAPRGEIATRRARQESQRQLNDLFARRPPEHKWCVVPHATPLPPGEGNQGKDW